MSLARAAALLPALAGASLLLAIGCRKPGSDDASAAAGTVSSVTTTTLASATPTPKAARRIKPPPPKPPEHANPGPEALARKARSEKRLKSEGVTMNPSLPVIDSEAEAKVRARDAVVDRAVALMLVALAAEGLETAQLDRHRETFGAASFFTADEKTFMSEPHPSAADKAKFGWNYECLGVMLWALGFDAELPRPAKMVDAARIVKLVLEKGPAKLREEARLRSARELLDAADVTYRYDWACVAARYSNSSAPAGVLCEVVVERHHALNWLIGYQGQDWDDVSTDT